MWSNVVSLLEVVEVVGAGANESSDAVVATRRGRDGCGRDVIEGRIAGGGVWYMAACSACSATKPEGRGT